MTASTQARTSPIGSQVDALERFDAEDTATVADDFLGVGTRIGMTWTRPVCPNAEARSGLVWQAIDAGSSRKEAVGGEIMI